MAKTSLPPGQDNEVVKVVARYPKAGLYIYEVVTGLLQSAEPENQADWDLAFQTASTVVWVGGRDCLPALNDIPPGRQLLRWEFEDGEVFPGRLRALSSYIADLHDEGETILTICAAGCNRSGLVNALVVRELTGCAGVVARIQVQTMRPGALKTPQYVKFLDDLPMIEETDVVELTVREESNAKGS